MRKLLHGVTSHYLREQILQLLLDKPRESIQVDAVRLSRPVPIAMP